MPVFRYESLKEKELREFNIGLNNIPESIGPNLEYSQIWSFCQKFNPAATPQPSAKAGVVPELCPQHTSANLGVNKFAFLIK